MTNLLSTFIPIEIEFPKITKLESDPEFDRKYGALLNKLIEELMVLKCFSPGIKPSDLKVDIKARYDLSF